MTKPALVLSNSLGTTSSLWDRQLPALTERFGVIRSPLRGHSDGPFPDGAWTLADLGRDVLALMDEHGVERASLAGVSLGGITSLWVAANAPERVEALVVCCSAAIFLPRETWVERAALVRSEGMAPVAASAADRWFTPAFQEREPEVVGEIVDTLAATPPEGYARCCDILRDADMRPLLGSITAPTLVISGTDDPAAPPERGQEVADGIDGARYELLDNVSHLANVEQPEKVTSLMLDHL